MVVTHCLIWSAGRVVSVWWPGGPALLFGSCSRQGRQGFSWRCKQRQCGPQGCPQERTEHAPCWSWRQNPATNNRIIRDLKKQNTLVRLSWELRSVGSCCNLAKRKLLSPHQFLLHQYNPWVRPENRLMTSYSFPLSVFWVRWWKPRRNSSPPLTFLSFPSAPWTWRVWAMARSPWLSRCSPRRRCRRKRWCSGRRLGRCSRSGEWSRSIRWKCCHKPKQWQENCSKRWEVSLE